MDIIYLDNKFDCCICNNEIQEDVDKYYECKFCQKILCKNCILNYMYINNFILPKCVCGNNLHIDDQINLFKIEEINKIIYDSMKIFIKKELIQNIDNYIEIYDILRIIKDKNSIDKLYYFYCCIFSIYQIIFYRINKKENTQTINELIEIKNLTKNSIFIKNLSDSNDMYEYFRNTKIDDFIYNLYSSLLYISINIDNKEAEKILYDRENFVKLESLISFINYKNSREEDGFNFILENNKLNYIFGINYNYIDLTNYLLKYIKAFIENFYIEIYRNVNIDKFKKIISNLQYDIYSHLILNENLNTKFYFNIINNYLSGYSYDYIHKDNIILSNCYNNCLGKVIINGDDAECNICKTKYCKNCICIKKDDKHVCDKNLLDNLNYLKLNSQQCPICGIHINKIEGCDNMFCIKCKNMFNYKTGNKIDNNLHNPEKKNVLNLLNENCDFVLCDVFNYDYYMHYPPEIMNYINELIDKLKIIRSYRYNIDTDNENSINSYILLYIYNYISIDELYNYVYPLFKYYCFNKEINVILQEKYNIIEDILQQLAKLTLIDVFGNRFEINTDEKSIINIINNANFIIYDIDKGIKKYKKLYSIIDKD